MYLGLHNFRIIVTAIVACILHVCGENGLYLELEFMSLDSPSFEISGMTLKGDLFFLKDQKIWT
jgi:hypothetical protein